MPERDRGTIRLETALKSFANLPAGPIPTSESTQCEKPLKHLGTAGA
jgi:hypothetical protein